LGCANPGPSVDSDMMVIVAGRQESRLATVSLDKVEPQPVAIELDRRFEVCDVQMDVPHAQFAHGFAAIHPCRPGIVHQRLVGKRRVGRKHGAPQPGRPIGRDLEAIAQGLEEVLDEHYLQYRIRSVEYLGEKLVADGVPIIEPPGGHAIYIDAKRFLPGIPPEQFPGQSIVCSLYIEGGIRAVEIGSVMFGKYDKNGKLIPPPMELVRLAIPRRVYTQSHIDFVLEVILEVFKNRSSLKGYKITYQAPMLRHFTAMFEEIK